MAVVALIVLVTWLLVVVGLRGYIAYRRTGVAPKLVAAEVGSPAWWAKVVSGVGIVLAFAAPVAELLGIRPLAVLDQAPDRVAGLVLALTGIVATFGAQLAMGESWSGDVDPQARTPLVTHGPFRIVRNPILTCTAATAIGLALMVPNVLAILMLVAFFVAIELQVRLVEEPYLERVHGDAYRAYAARTGRFLPGIGLLRR
jgi:protein-S-isoprenylcysteine O-methyltransferase Ste14